MDKVPNEVKLDIFSQLEHNDLYRCMRVSKSFKALVEHPAFDKVLFRSKKAIRGYDLVDPEKLHLHPAFSHLRCLCRGASSDISFRFDKENINGIDEDIFTPLTETSAANRNATEPAVTCITILPYGYVLDEFGALQSAITVQNKEGVTVLQVMKAHCKLCVMAYGGLDRYHHLFKGLKIDRRPPLGRNVILFGKWDH